MGRRLGYGVAVLVSSWVAMIGCGGGSQGGAPSDGGGSPHDAGSDRTGAAGTGGAPSNGAGGGGTGGGGAGGNVVSADGCSDLFAPKLQTFSIDIAASDWAAIEAEFLTAGALTLDAFASYQPHFYPVVFHFGGDVAQPAWVRLKGDSSWREAAALYGAAGKMQFVVAFDQLDSTATFHGVGKIGFDMPPEDRTFMHDRVGNTWMRSIGITALCATNARLEVNGAYYGLFVAEERVGRRLLEEFFPGNADNDLFKGGRIAETNTSSPNWTKLQSFWSAVTPDALGAVVDLPQSFLTWAAEAMLNDGDGYWGGDHNFYLYDQGAKGYVFLPNDLDSILDFIADFSGDPVWWWSARPGVQFIGQQYLTVMNDPTLRGQYVNAVATQLGRFDVAQLQSWLDQWSAQIRDAVAADPHKPSSTTLAVFDDAVAQARAGVQTRSAFVSRWLQCKRTGAGDDQDGDGYVFCNDCNDSAASIHPGAAEICGNQTDDNCNGLYDEGCPGGGITAGGANTPHDGGAD